MTEFQKFLAHKAYLMRVNSLKMTTHAGSGHPTSALSAADLVAVLFFSVMKFDPKDPYNPNNDRFILSKGHASPIFYAVYKELGVLTQDELMTYRSIHSSLEGHPTPRFAWTEAATGSLGQGLSVGVGMGINAKMDKLDYTTYVLMGDSEVAEGSVWEALELGSFYKLNNLVGILDVNRLGQSTQTMEGWDVGDYARKAEAFGWRAFIVDGHNIEEIMHAFSAIQDVHDAPCMLIAKTIKGYGIPGVENKEGYHGKAFSSQELAKILPEMQERFKEFVTAPAYTWKPHLPHMIGSRVQPHTHISLGDAPFTKGESVATRQAYGKALVALGDVDQTVVALDAEVSNSTYSCYFAEKYPNRFIECFIAEQNMVGMAVGLHKRGKIPFASTFGAFFSRAYDQIRMASIGRAALRLVGSHAGVSIGQDGPSQMALEDIAIMRAVHDSAVVYPSDAVSTWKLTELVANRHDGISYVRTTRAATPVLYSKDEQFPLGGCKVVRESEHDVALVVAAGITLHEALKAHEQLKNKGISIAVIDLYSIKPIDQATLIRMADRCNKRVITVEDHYAQGGLGDAVNTALINQDVHCTNLAVNIMPRSGKPEELLALAKIDAAAIVAACRATVGGIG